MNVKPLLPSQAAIAVALCIAAHLTLAFSMTYALLDAGDQREFTVMGVCFGQINLIGLWGALAAGRVAGRLPWMALLATGMWFALALGNRVRGVWEAHNDYDRGDALALGGLILLGVMATLVPLWLSRWWFRWRLTASPSPIATVQQFNLRELLLATALACAALALVQAILPSGTARPTLDAKVWIAAPIAMAANLLVTLPTIWMAFARPALAALLLVVVLPLYVLLVSLSEIAVVEFALGGGGGLRGDALWCLAVLNAGQCFVVVGTLAFLRWVGFRLAREAISLNVPSAAGSACAESQRDR
jgi:hypothetical protein